MTHDDSWSKAFVLWMLAIGFLFEPGSSVLAQADTDSIGPRGFVRRPFTDKAGANNPYVIFVPFIEPPAEQGGYPVIVFLNGRGENGADGVQQIANNFGREIWEMRHDFPFIAIAPQCSESCLLYTSPSPRDQRGSRMPSSA